MTVSVQLLYPRTAESTFDYDYFVNSHMKLVARHWGGLMQVSSIAKGVSGGPGVAPAWALIATMHFTDQAALERALADSDEINADVANYTNTTPTLLIGEILA